MGVIRSVIAQWIASIHKEGCDPCRFATLINWRRILGKLIRDVVRRLVVYMRVKSLPFHGAVTTPSKILLSNQRFTGNRSQANGLRRALRRYNLLAVISGRATAMNFNIYLDSTLGAALQRLAKRRKVARNALIRQAVEDLLAKESRTEEWSEAVLSWQGEPNFPPFESHRSTLSSPTDDPLA